MPSLKDIAKTVLPPISRRQLKGYWRRSRYWSEKPSGTPLSQELMRLERSKSERPLKGLFDFPEMYESAWIGLESLAYQIVLHYRPKVIVELGTHMGLSALAMGLALKKIGEGGQIYAIDSWEGDPQAGHYSGKVYETFLKRIEEAGLDKIIIPLKMYFDEARDKVATPIDLLHIDGLHTWDAVSHDWETFGPLVRPGGLVMFHDIHTHFEDLRKFWAGLSTQFESHTVPYSNGLGLLRTKVG